MRRLWALATTVVIGIAASGIALSASSQASSPVSLNASTLLDLANVTAPPAGIGLQLHADFPAFHPYDLSGVPVTALTAEITPAGLVKVVDYVTAPDRSSNAATAGSGSGGAGESSACSDSTYQPTGQAWDATQIPIHWRFNQASTPKGLSKFLALRAVRTAHHVWPQVETNCKDDIANGFKFHFDGITTKGVAYDHVNSVSFGSLDSGALAMNYTWYKDGHALEVDLRFNGKDYKWTNQPNAKHAYEIRDVTAHELGHQLGLDDLGGTHTGLTMYGVIGMNELKKTTLGRGDIRGAKAVSP